MPTSSGSSPRKLLVSSRYLIQRKLGSGSMGSVYLAFDESTARPVALKILEVGRFDPEGIAELQREFRAFASLHHPQIAAAYDFGYTEEGRLPYYTREYIAGSPLEPGPPPRVAPGEFLKPIIDLLGALDYLHAHEILHLDIHAGNLIVSEAGRRGSVLIDFGVRGPLGSSGSHRILRAGASVPPEVLAGGAASPATDLYSVGRLLFHRLAGSLEGETRLPRELPGWSPRLVVELERIVQKATQRDSRRRFQAAPEFLDALCSALGTDRGQAPLAEPRDVTVGRDAETEAIEEALRRAAEGKAAFLWIEGGPGMGKSRLLAEGRLRAQLRGLEVVEARFFDPQAAEPPFLKALASSRRRAGGPEWLRPLAIEHGGSSAERARRSAAACFETDGAPLVILLDDMEQADPESRVLAEALRDECLRRRAEAAGRGLALIIAGASAVPLAMKALAGKRSILRLKPLSAKQSAGLLGGLLSPLVVTRPAALELARAARGVPGRLRRLARGLRTALGRRGVVREGEIPDSVWSEAASAPRTGAGESPMNSRILRGLLLLERPASIEEIAAAMRLPLKGVRVGVRSLMREEIVAASSGRGSRLYSLAHADDVSRRIGPAPPGEARRVHARMARFLRAAAERDPLRLEALARHLFAAGRGAAAREVAIRAGEVLRQHGRLQAAAGLLREAFGHETDRRWKLRFAEETSACFHEAGDHLEGIQTLEPWYRGGLKDADHKTALRIRRRLGVHNHRAGFAEVALKLFEEVRALADPVEDVEEVVFVDTELAEMHTLRGQYARAEEACRRGLTLIEGSPGLSAEFRRTMEVMLRASLGHLELRRMALGRAKQELEAALALASRRGSTSLRALILNNLGIVHNHLNDFRRARRHYAKAESLLERTGDRAGALHAALNQATIAAKQGDSVASRESLERAYRFFAHSPEARVEFSVELARGMTAHFLGDHAAAAQTFEKAIPMGVKLGDAQFTAFAMVYFAEAQMACGRYKEAARLLRGMSARARSPEASWMSRIIHARLFLLEGLLGRQRASELSRRSLSEAPRTGTDLLEAWNDLFIAAGLTLRGEDSEAASLSSGALELFSRIGVPAGARLAQVGLLHLAIRRGDPVRLRARLKDLESAVETEHKLLEVLEPLAKAEARFALGELERADELLGAAAGAIVGLPYLELDWRIELLRARMAEKRGDREETRQLLRRSLQSRDLLAGSLPARSQIAFKSHPRFRVLEELSTRVRHRLTPVSGGPARSCAPTEVFHGIVGRSEQMARIFETMERLRDHDMPVLISGETGTGKELVARALHAMGPRRTGPFFALHCASLPPELFESELFGYEAGAFTGAEESRPGLLETLSGGTLLLDEISSLSPGLQAKLLGVIESRRARPLGASEARAVDVRFLASTSVDLEAVVARGELRPELYYRLGAIALHIPPLRARREDIPLLARHFLEVHARRLEGPQPVLASNALACLLAYDWPGNVRQLEAVLLRVLVTLSPGEQIHAQALRPHLTQWRGRPLFGDDFLAGRSLKDLRKELERAYLTRLFRTTHGDLDAMAKLLGVKVSNLYHWLRRVDLEIRELRREE